LQKNDEEAEESDEEEEGQRGLGDFGFGSMYEEGDVEAAAKALEMEIAEDRQRTKDVIFHIMEEKRRMQRI
jgi:hypothetical protein